MTNNAREGSRGVSFTKFSTLLLVALLSLASSQSDYSPITFVACVNVNQKTNAQMETVQKQALSLQSRSQASTVINTQNHQQEKTNDVDLLIDMQDGINMMQHAFLNKKQSGGEEAGQQKQQLELSQVKSSTESSDTTTSLNEVKDEMWTLKQSLKGMNTTQFVVNGVVWNVWDWTLFVFLVAVICVAAVVAFLFCLCCAPTKYEEEMEANEVQSNKSRDESLKEREETERRVAVSLAAAMEATKDRPEREIKGKGDAEAPAKMEGELENME